MLRKVLSFPFMPRGSGAYDPPALRRQLENLVSTLTRVLGEHGSTINRLVDTANALPPHNDGFEEGEPNLLQKDHSHVTPIGWRFIHHSQGSFNLFGYSQLTPANSPGSYSYGSETFYAAMGSWSIAKEYQVHGGGSLTVSVQVRANKNGPWVAPGAGEDFYAEDDGFLIIEEFTGTGDLYKRTFSTTASHQEYDRNGDYNYQDFVECSHTLTVLDRTSYVRVTLVATDKTNSPGPIPVYSPNANVLFDDFSFTYDRKYYDITMFGGIHEHSEMYAYGSASASNLVLTDSYQAVKGIWSGVSLQDPNYSFDTSTGVLTVYSPGKYEIYFSTLIFITNGDTARSTSTLRLNVNGSVVGNVQQYGYHRAGTESTNDVQFSTIRTLNARGTLSVWVKRRTGTSQLELYPHVTRLIVKKIAHY